MTLARDPQTVFFIEMTLGIKRMVVTKEMVDAGGRNSLNAQSLRTINICLPKCFAWVDEALQ